ncbi:MAG: hypothetical protein IJ699_02590 [Bacteroidaceae bacterium]|nr:hypothetical protein [Bacteroidaceae bacterium]
MFIKNKSSRAGSEAQYGPRLAGALLHNYLENSDDDLAVAFRNQSTAAEEAQDDRLFRGLFPDTHLCVDLKIISRRRGRMPVGAYINCMLTRDDEDHFTAMETASERKQAAERRNPIVFSGVCVNVHRAADGSLYAVLKRPKFTGDFTFRDFCSEAAEELRLVSGLGEEGVMR